MALKASENGSRLARRFLNEHPKVRREDYLTEGERLTRDRYKDGMKRFLFVEAWRQVAKHHVFSSDRARAARIQALLDVINEEGYPARSERAKHAEQELMALGAEGKCGVDGDRLYVAEDM
jgi:predicted ArsR family transcriptional regulator